MDFEVSFKHPHKVFLSNELRQEFGVAVGEPVELRFDGIDEPIVVKCSRLSDIKESEEYHSLLFSLHYCVGELGEVHDGIFEEFNNSGLHKNEVIDSSFQGVGKISTYLTKLRHLVDHRISHADLLVGCGIADYLVKSETDEAFQDIRSPFSRFSKTCLADSFNNDLPECESVSRYNGDIVEPNDLFVCTYGLHPSDKQKEGIVEKVNDDKYFMPDINYQYGTNRFLFHGMMYKDDIDADLTIASLDNIGFLEGWEYRIGSHGDAEIRTEEVKNRFIDLSGDFFEFNVGEGEDIDKLVSESEVIIDIQDSGDAVLIDIKHADEDELEMIREFLNELIQEMEGDYDSKLHLYGNRSAPSDALDLDTLVFDTNSIYRQKPGTDFNPIIEFLLTNPQVYEKNVVVPWNVIIEINRHKDSGSNSTQKASEQGLTNLKVLSLFDQEDVIDLTIEDVPKWVDNSVQPNSGAADLSILNSVPEDGVLLTSDRYLSKIASLTDVPTERIEDLSGFTKNKERNPYWDLLSDLLQNEGPMEYNELIDRLENNPINTEDNIDESDPDTIIRDRINDGYLVEMVEDNERTIALSQSVTVIPTFPLINSLSSEVNEFNSSKYLSPSALESIRVALGGMSTAHRPVPTFIIPSEYVFRASEISQIESLELLNNINNAKVRTLKIKMNDGLGSDVEQALIRSSVKEDGTILCLPNDDVRKFQLLDLDFKTISI